MYGAQLIEALHRRDPSIQFFGVGGDRMRAAGCETVVDSRDLAVVGITEILSRLPKILGLYRRLIREANHRKPDIAIVIDAPAFNWRVARQMKRRGIRTVYYVAPQFWAWRQGRVRLLRDYIDTALVIFPFEEYFYRERGVNATFVGHPLAELSHPAGDRAEYATQFQLDPLKFWITLMPGSRINEVRMNLPTILESAALLGSAYEYLLPVAPTLDPHFLRGLVGSRKITLVPESLPALWHSRAGIVASGTATVEAAMMNTPVRDGLSRFSADLPSGQTPRESFAVCHGQPDCRRRCCPRTGAGRFHGTECRRPYSHSPAGRPSSGANDRRVGPRESPAEGSRGFRDSATPG